MILTLYFIMLLDFNSVYFQNTRGSVAFILVRSVIVLLAVPCYPNISVMYCSFRNHHYYCHYPRLYPAVKYLLATILSILTTVVLCWLIVVGCDSITSSYSWKVYHRNLIRPSRSFLVNEICYSRSFGCYRISGRFVGRLLSDVIR